MLNTSYFSTLIPFLTATNCAPLLPSYIESISVNTAEGFVNGGCFCKLSEDKLSIENLDDSSTTEDVYGIIINDRGKIIKNGNIAQLILMSSVFRATPVIIDDINRVADSLKIIKWTKDNSKYPLGAMIFSEQDTDDYHTLEISGTLIEYETK
jgi:hypothetical protein